MTNKQLANILTQFLYNIGLDDLSLILKANEATIYAQMNLPLSSQLHADKLLKDSIERVFNRASQTDLKRLSEFITKEATKREV